MVIVELKGNDALEMNVNQPAGRGEGIRKRKQLTIEVSNVILVAIESRALLIV